VRMPPVKHIQVFVNQGETAQNPSVIFPGSTVFEAIRLLSVA